jgi:hypothetical protein
LINLFFDQDDYPNQRLLATITVVFPEILEFRVPSATGKFFNASLVAKLGPLCLELAHQEAAKLPPDTDDALTLNSARLVRRTDLAHLDPVTDEDNIFPYLLARSHLRIRSVLSNMPPHLLVN